MGLKKFFLSRSISFLIKQESQGVMTEFEILRLVTRLGPQDK